MTVSAPLPGSTETDFRPPSSSAPSNRKLSVPASPTSRRRSTPLPVSELEIDVPTSSLMISLPFAVVIRSALLEPSPRISIRSSVPVPPSKISPVTRSATDSLKTSLPAPPS